MKTCILLYTGELQESSAEAFYAVRGAHKVRTARFVRRAIAEEVAASQDAAAVEDGQDSAAASAATPSARLLQQAAVITEPTCRARWLTERMARDATPSPHVGAAPFIGGNLETPGVLEAMLRARAPDQELIFLSVGDTRDHRRAQKDPVR